MKKFVKFRNVRTHVDVYQEDCERIQRVLQEREYEVSLEIVATIWERISEDYYSASWLILPDSDEGIWNMIQVFIENYCVWEEE